MRLIAVLFAAVALAACQSSAPTGPPEGWVGEGNRWWVAGADTAAAFRDLDSFETMGVDAPPSEFAGWVRDKLLVLYRTNPEVVDSVYTAGFVPDLAPPAGAADYAAESESVANQLKRDFYQRYNHTNKMPGPGLAIPDSLTGVRGEVVMQVYVNRDTQPVAVQLLEGTGTYLDTMAMRDAATASYTEAWVRPRAGQSAGVKIPSWIRVTQRFGDS